MNTEENIEYLKENLEYLKDCLKEFLEGVTIGMTDMQFNSYVRSVKYQVDKDIKTIELMEKAFNEDSKDLFLEYLENLKISMNKLSEGLSIDDELLGDK